MKKITTAGFCILSACVFLCVQCFGEIKRGDIFIVKKGCYVPVFTSWDVNLIYEIGSEGTNCYRLDTVLWSDTAIRVINVLRNKNVEVEFFLSDRVRGEGFVHLNFFDRAMVHADEETWENTLNKKLAPLPLEKIRKIFQRCVDERVPYCYGANNFKKIDLRGMYEFTAGNTPSALNRPYELRGFDSSGLLHFVSNGILPHCTHGLDRMDQVIFIFDTKKKHSLEEKRMVLGMMQDSDYVVIRQQKNRFRTSKANSVLISFNGGFLEFRNHNDGLVYTRKKNALERLNFLLEEGLKKGGNLVVIRWHSELLGEEMNY
ncbi:MAG: hypothetical protein LBI81_01200 [Puniceicoccales bacterium]|jgi:hypothetical protein|nr:hypothetical protein [Puniceicoccales bacterium]